MVPRGIRVLIYPYSLLTLFGYKMAMEKIKGGYIVKARKTRDSEIACAPPHVREIWDWLLFEANYKDMKTYGVVIKRGQLFTSYQKILDGLSWKVGWRVQRYTKHQCEEAMKFLRRGGMITTTKTTRGMLINIINYAFYQDYKNYEGHTEGHNEDRRSPQSRHTISNEVNASVMKEPNTRDALIERRRRVPEAEKRGAIRVSDLLPQLNPTKSGG